jgi:rod shape-determining protein MreB
VNLAENEYFLVGKKSRCGIMKKECDNDVFWKKQGAKMGFFRENIGIDLGTTSILVYVEKKGIVLSEPSVVALDRNTNKILAVGEEARQMLGRTPGNIVAIKPLKDGVISDYEVTEKMLKYFIKKSIGTSLFKPKIIVCVPSGVTEVEKRAVVSASNQAGASKTYLIEEPVAAAIGAGLDITQPDGHLIIDMGGGTTDIAVISLGGIVVSRSIKVAGNKFDEAIMRYMRKKHNMMIGERTAEDLKINIGSAYPLDQEKYMDARGRNLVSGLPKTIKVSSSEIREAIEEPVAQIADAVHSVLEKTPPELAADISDKGIVMAGGASMLGGLDKLLQKRTGIPVYVAEDSISCVAVGTGKALEHFDVLASSVLKKDTMYY